MPIAPRPAVVACALVACAPAADPAAPSDTDTDASDPLPNLILVVFDHVGLDLAVRGAAVACLMLAGWSVTIPSPLVRPASDDEADWDSSLDSSLAPPPTN